MPVNCCIQCLSERTSILNKDRWSESQKFQILRIFMKMRNATSKNAGFSHRKHDARAQKCAAR